MTPQPCAECGQLARWQSIRTSDLYCPNCAADIAAVTILRQLEPDHREAA